MSHAGGMRVVQERWFGLKGLGLSRAELWIKGDRGFSHRGNASCREHIPSVAKAQDAFCIAGGTAKAEPFQNGDIFRVSLEMADVIVGAGGCSDWRLGTVLTGMFGVAFERAADQIAGA